MHSFVFKLFLLSAGLCLWNSCASPPAPAAPPPALPGPEVPPPLEVPRYSLNFERAQVLNLRRVSLHYSLAAENPRARALGMDLRGWRVLLNGKEWAFPGGEKGTLETTAPKAGTAALPLSLDLDLPEEGGDFDEYHAVLELSLAAPEGEIPLKAEALFPRIRAPEFTIASIAIIKAELVNTRFRVDLTIDNPNIFPVSLSSLSYELYGKGRFWARGRERNVLAVPARGQAAARLFLEMNFTNMRRDLLDEVIALGMVPYRFTGEALVDTGLPLLPSFKTDFDRQGSSVVIK
jgi:LEA14-like dessication related protein